MSKSWSQGKFTPEHPEKYLGDADKITYRSSWELHFNQYVDSAAHVKHWASEELEIKYFHPFHKEIRKYYPDYFVVYVDKDGREHKEVIEIKPENQIILPKRVTKDMRITHMINVAKWTACKRFCESQGIQFRLCTEQQLFGK